MHRKQEIFYNSIAYDIHGNATWPHRHHIDIVQVIIDVLKFYSISYK